MWVRATYRLDDVLDSFDEAVAVDDGEHRKRINELQPLQ